MTDSLEPEIPEEVVAPSGPQDIDPGQWLTASNGTLTDLVDTKAGRLKIAALTEKEADTIRKQAESIDPRNPRQRTISAKKLRLSTVAASVNKAYGYTPANPQFITIEKLEAALTGEVTMIVNAITKLSGFVEETQGQNPGEFFQVS